ncbi:hypothetical protein DAEQUDRAFT_726794 [Daedalea quercina L-15889]|uniref:Uncharacterized protein n=1 Tax=Daedalea quercina L-15889 TaxID=1314783 RepID=A0A165QAK9_9APHY|nr:hypothetical protein DAEQUDRAFT_726794 [Daedalea quercina L-15889]
MKWAIVDLRLDGGTITRVERWTDGEDTRVRTVQGSFFIHLPRLLFRPPQTLIFPPGHLFSVQPVGEVIL